MNRNDLFVSDLDGTLLTDEGRLSPKSRDKLQQLINSGLNFTVASARSLHTISDLFQGVNFSLPVICLNGAYISDLNTQKHLVINEIQGEVRKKIEEYIEQYGIGVYVSSHHEGTDFLYYNTLNNEGLSWYYNDRITNNDTRLRNTDSLDELSNHHITCFTFIDRKQKLEKIEQELLQEYDNQVEIHLFENIYSKGWYWLTVHDRRATKDQAIRQIQEKFNLNDKRLIVFGDHINDIKMFRIAHKCIAVQNADERLKEHAHEIIGMNTEDSVVNYLDTIFR